MSDFAYKDQDLFPVLHEAKTEELEMLVKVLCKKTSCSIDADCRNPAAIAHELQLMGGNTLVNIPRRHGVCYAEIVGNVAGQVSVDLDGCKHIHEKEWRIVKHLVQQAEAKMDEGQRKAFYEEAEKQTGRTVKGMADMLKNPFLMYIILRIIVQQLLMRMGIAAGAGILGWPALAMLAGPVGWVLGGLWAAVSIAGPAYSVTVPCVLIVAMIRTRLAAEEAARNVGDRK